MRTESVRKTAAHGRQGFTLIELMVVLAIVGVLMTSAVIMMRPSEYAGSVRTFTNAVANELEATRQRAVASQKVHQVEVNSTNISIYRSDEEGMDEIAAGSWEPVKLVVPPTADVEVSAYDATAHAAYGSGPAPGTGIGSVFYIYPDGSADGATIFIKDASDERYARVVTYPTGTTYAYDEW